MQERDRAAAKPAPREDDTVRTTLRNATERCRRVSQQCAQVSRGVRKPTPGTVDRVDLPKLRKIAPVPRVDDPPLDPVTRLIALVLGGERRR